MKKIAMSESYFQSYKDYFWEWDDRNDFIAIPRSNVIGFRKIIADHVIALSDQGLPPFGSLLLALAAMIDGNKTGLTHIRNLLSSKAIEQDNAMLAGAMEFLDKLQNLPSEYKYNSTKSLMVLQSIFQDCHGMLSKRHSKDIANICREKPKDFGSDLPSQEFNRQAFWFDFRTIELLNDKYKTSEDIIAKIAPLPDVNQLNIEFEETPQVSNQPLDFIDELIDHDKTFTTGSLVRWLWGGLNIPVHSALPSEQPIGGVSDLTNKGSFDKLLISEFAYDDITFLSRLANNEALYLHREIPPTSNDLSRIILIDSTIKNWGTPKIIAFAVSLAIASHPKTEIDCEVYVLSTEAYHPVSIENIHEIINGLQILSASLSAASSLASFMNEYGGDRNKEIFLITESTTLKNPRMLKVMNDHHDSINYVVLTDSDGNVDVYKRHQRSRKHLQHIQIPLQELWKRRKVKPVTERSSQTEISSIPILLKNPGSTRRIVTAPDGEVFQLSSNWAILKLADKTSLKNKGWIMMYPKVPMVGQHFEMGISDKGDYVALAYEHNERRIVLINLTDRTEKVIPFPHWRSTAWPSFVFKGDRFYHASSTGGWSISTDGVVKSTDRLEHNSFLERQTQILEAQKKYESVPMILKNINNIYISQHAHLVFNIHELTVSNNHIKFVQANDKSILVQANKLNDQEFTFGNGSKIEINRNGFIILRHHDPDKVPPVYIPTALDGVIALATETQFAGNDFYSLINIAGSQKKLDLMDFYRHTVERYIKDAIHNT